jgi:hypothetical protein
MPVLLGQIPYIITMVGLIGGGLWAVWTFHKLRKVRSAELAIQESLAATQKSRIEEEELRRRLLSQQPQLAIELSVTETASPTETYKSFLGVTVTLKNEGEQNLQVDFDTSALSIGHIVFEKNGEHITDVRRFGPKYFTSHSKKPQFVPYRIFRVGQKRQIVLAVLPVTEPGGYLVQFHALYSKVPFDGEEPSSEGTNPIIDATEQTVYFATGKPDKSTSND